MNSEISLGKTDIIILGKKPQHKPKLESTQTKPTKNTQQKPPTFKQRKQDVK